MEPSAHTSPNSEHQSPNDLLIAAIALTHNLTLVTHNISEFSRVPGLTIEDWESQERLR